MKKKKSYNDRLKVSEAQVLKTCIDYLKLHSKVAWAERMNTGAMKDTYTNSSGEKKTRFIRFSFKGCSDIIGQLTDGRWLAVECKRPEYDSKGNKEACVTRLSDTQKAFLDLVERNGGLAFVTDAVDDLEWFLGNIEIKENKP